MHRLFKPLRVLAAIGCFTLVNAAFLAPTIAVALCEESKTEWAAIARWQFWPALVALDFTVLVVIAAATALLGRVYCSTLCPLGVFQDIVIRIRRVFGGGVPPGHATAPCTRTRIAVFAFAVGSALGGLMALPALVDPYSVWGRGAAHLLRPFTRFTLNLVAAWGESRGEFWLISEETALAGPLALAVAAGTLVLVAAIAAWKGRWICNAICPVGTALAAISSRPLLRLRIEPKKCVGCGRCERVCRTGSVNVAEKTIDNRRRVRCFDCIGACGKGAIKP